MEHSSWRQRFQPTTSVTNSGTRRGEEFPFLFCATFDFVGSHIRYPISSFPFTYQFAHISPSYHSPGPARSTKSSRSQICIPTLTSFSYGETPHHRLLGSYVVLLVHYFPDWVRMLTLRSWDFGRSRRPKIYGGRN